MLRVILGALLSVCAVLPAHALTIYQYVNEHGVVTYTDKARPGAKIFSFDDKPIAQPKFTVPDTRVRVETQDHEAGRTLILHNELFAPVDVEISLENVSNAVNAPTEPIRWVLAPRSHIRLVTVAPQNPAAKVEFTPKLRYALGDPRLLPQSYRYPLPWAGGPFRLTQGANGGYSHFTPKGRYAMDIAMPVGTPILAAREGVVVKVENNQQGRGNNPAGNFVRILHKDSTMGVYLHLEHGSVQVVEGQHVRVGQQIARSGNTGNSTGPHLHFVVQRNVGLDVVSIPFEFNQAVNSLPNFAVGGN